MSDSHNPYGFKYFDRPGDYREEDEEEADSMISWTSPVRETVATTTANAMTAPAALGTAWTKKNHTLTPQPLDLLSILCILKYTRAICEGMLTSPIR